MVIGDGKIIMVGEFNPKAAAHHEVIDHRPQPDPAGPDRSAYPFSADAGDRLLCGQPARVAQHLHLRRGAAVRRRGACRRASPARFFDELIRHGTTTAAAYCSVHPQSVDAFFGEAAKRNMLMVGGKVMMDRNAPEALRDTPQSGYDDTKARHREVARQGPGALRDHAALRDHLDARADGDGRGAGARVSRTSTSRPMSTRTSPRSRSPRALSEPAGLSRHL